MSRQRTLRSRIILHFCAYLAVLLLAYTFAFNGAIMTAQDVVFNRQISVASENIAAHLETHGSLPATMPARMTAYLALNNIPDTLRRHVEGVELGILEINDESLNYHAAVRQVGGRTLYVFYDVASLEFSAQFQLILLLALLALGAGILLVGWMLARSMSDHILKPISRLSESVCALSPGEQSPSLASYEAQDEIGTLVDTINHLLERIAAFTQREREFTAHASHELRNPATVIKGAVEVLRDAPEQAGSKAREPLARIERAVTDIEMLIDTFLLLARKDKAEPTNEVCDLKQIVGDVVDAHRHLLDRKSVEDEVRTDGAGSLTAPGTVVSIAVANLVRNAFQYTMEGRVEVTALDDRVRVVDTGPGLGSAAGGSGLGLTIVKRVCEHMDWTFSISDDDGGTCAELVF